MVFADCENAHTERAITLLTAKVVQVAKIC